jgi:hypothetical protein
LTHARKDESHNNANLQDILSQSRRGNYSDAEGTGDEQQQEKGGADFERVRE